MTSNLIEQVLRCWDCNVAYCVRYSTDTITRENRPLAGPIRCPFCGGAAVDVLPVCLLDQHDAAYLDNVSQS